MFQAVDLILSRLRFVFFATVAVACLLLVWFLVVTMGATAAQTNDTSASADVLSADVSDNSNGVTVGLSQAMQEFGQTVSSATDTVHRDVKAIRLPKLHAGKFIAHTSGSIAHGVGSGLTSVTHGVVGGFASAFHVPGNVLGLVFHTAVVSAVVKPADHDLVPIIDPNSLELFAAQAALPASNALGQAGSQTNSAVPQWPIHGEITTLFGVPELPYQAIHTGLDISDGQRPGVTPIKPFRPERVLETDSSGLSLDNHVVVDHDSGVTSVYGHLNSISVQVGRESTRAPY